MTIIKFIRRGTTFYRTFIWSLDNVSNKESVIHFVAEKNYSRHWENESDVFMTLGKGASQLVGAQGKLEIRYDKK